MPLTIPRRLADTCRKTPDGTLWLERLPDIVRGLEDRWSLKIGEPFDSADVSCAWVAPAARADRTRVVLKLGMPHMEGEHELQGLRFWNGHPTVRLIEADEDLNAMLLERCEPGTSLRERPEPEQDSIIARLLRRLWRTPSAPHPFRPLSTFMPRRSPDTIADAKRWPDAGLVREGFRVFRELLNTTPAEVLLATDLHAGNVLRAKRETWLVIDPKPFVGDPAFDATQHLFNCEGRLRSDPERTIRQFADSLGVDHERVRLWMFARAATELPDDLNDRVPIELVQALAR